MNMNIAILSFIMCFSMSGLLHTALHITLSTCGLDDVTSDVLARAASILIGIEALFDFALVCLIH